MLKADGRSIDFFLASTGKYFHSFKAQNPQEAESLRRTWEKLEAGAR
jgi:hypothetical protein